MVRRSRSWKRPLRVADAAGRRGDQVAHHQAGSDEVGQQRALLVEQRHLGVEGVDDGSDGRPGGVGVRQQVRDRDAEIADPRGPDGVAEVENPDHLIRRPEDRRARCRGAGRCG